jgi:hypothetical protein
MLVELQGLAMKEGARMKTQNVAMIPGIVMPVDGRFTAG